MDLKKVSVRELQHNLSEFLELAKSVPLLVTRYGKEEVIMIDPKKFKISESKKNKKVSEGVMSLPFVGMYKNREDWVGKSTIQIASELRYKATYGK